MFNPQTTVRGPLDPTQHYDSCKSETENCGVQWTPVESEMRVIFLGSMRVKDAFNDI